MLPWFGVLAVAISGLPLACQAGPPTTANSSGLTVDLGYGVYKGIYNSSVRLNTWKG